MSTSLLHSDSGDLDLLDARPFSVLDHEILISYETVVDGVAMLIGGYCEIVLHFLEDLKCSAVRIANGEHTGRKVGFPIAGLALRMLYDMIKEDSSVSLAYFTRIKISILMKSVAIFIRKQRGDRVAAH